ncbi:MOSC domain-containing protein [Candidatus Roizmanbacteria bacterium]|nr:MOSC domain-containing protein [Candidatus Roizmanbacteria bacterium]
MSVETEPEFETTIELEPASPIVLAIYTSPGMGEPMEYHDSILAIAGEGLEGDRYKRRGAWSEERTGVPGRRPDDDRQVTFISSVGIEEANKELEALGKEPFEPQFTRRNIVVSMSPEHLSALNGKGFMVGDVLMEGTYLCTPCTRPAMVSGRGLEVGKAFERAFQGRGGLGARIKDTRMIHVGDKITILPQIKR